MVFVVSAALFCTASVLSSLVTILPSRTDAQIGHHPVEPLSDSSVSTKGPSRGAENETLLTQLTLDQHTVTEQELLPTHAKTVRHKLTDQEGSLTPQGTELRDGYS